MLPSLRQFATNISTGAAAFTPASLSLTGYWKAGGYSTSGSSSGTFAGTASLGTSGGRDLTEGTNPPADGGGFPTFDGVNDKLQTALTLADFFTASAWSMFVLFNAATALADVGAGSRYANAQFLGGATNAAICMGFSSAGVHLVGGPTGTAERVIACGTGAWHLAQAKYDGTDLKLRVDSSAWSSIATGNTNAPYMADALRVGANYALTRFLNHSMREMGLANTALSDFTFDAIKGYVNATYGLAL